MFNCYLLGLHFGVKGTEEMSSETEGSDLIPRKKIPIIETQKLYAGMSSNTAVTPYKIIILFHFECCEEEFLFYFSRSRTNKSPGIDFGFILNVTADRCSATEW